MTSEEFREVLCPPPDQRMMIVGASGTGKTTLAREILRQYPRVLVVDPKCTYGGKEGEPGYTFVRTPMQLRMLNKGHTHIQFRPGEHHQTLSAYNAVYEWAYRMGQNGIGYMVYTDETYLVMAGTLSPKWLTNCMTCGRELGVGMICASQRPVGVDRRIFTEAETFAAFRLMHEDDFKLAARRLREFREPEGHSFWIRHTDWKKPRYLRLHLSGKQIPRQPSEVVPATGNEPVPSLAP